MGRRGSLLALTAALAIAAGAGAGEIGIYADPNCTGCEITIPPFGGVDTLYVSVLNDGDPPVPCGPWICGAGFRIEGLPEGWAVDARPNPEACFVYGSPFGPEGVWVDLCGYGCTGDPCIPLYTLVLTTYLVRADVHLRIVGGLPCFSYGICPAVLTGDQPCDPTCHCYPGGEIIVNPVNDHCTVSVAPQTWSQVRRLYGM